jgi:hypothetical protein
MALRFRQQIKQLSGSKSSIPNIKLQEIINLARAKAMVG